MLPPPAIRCTIPSIQDDLPLSCRVYHPASLCPSAIAQIPEKRWRKRIAIVAHPYAPLGGCYDDPVVELVAGAILKEGYIVGTFNFRGAGDSKGHTSWQSKPEQNDYISFLAFMIYYVRLLSPPLPSSRPQSASSDMRYDLSPVPSQCLPPPRMPLEFKSVSNELQKNNSDVVERVIIGGFSYGALIAMYLPSSLEAILEPFQHAAPGSAYSEIRLRACHLAGEQSSILDTNMQSLLAEASHSRTRGRSQISDYNASSGIHNPKTRQPSSGMRVGGEEDIRRASYDSYRPRNSFTISDTPEKVRKSIDRVRSLAREKGRFSSGTSPTRGIRRQDSSDSGGSFQASRKASTKKKAHTASADLFTHSPTKQGNFKSTSSLEAKTGQADPNILPVAHLLGTPTTLTTKTTYLLVSPPINFFASLATLWSSSSRAREAAIAQKLATNRTLVVFADDDDFVSVRKFRAWAEKLSALPSSPPSLEASSSSSSSPHLKGESVPQRRRVEDGDAKAAAAAAAGAGGFTFTEVNGGGHFWRDRVAAGILRAEVRRFAREF